MRNAMCLALSVVPSSSHMQSKKARFVEILAAEIYIKSFDLQPATFRAWLAKFL
jgi:hypothetical protein